jgi:hypothetical protein
MILAFGDINPQLNKHKDDREQLAAAYNISLILNDKRTLVANAAFPISWASAFW